MNRNRITLLASAALFAATPAMAIVLGTNITIPDNNYSGTGWYGPQEDNETEANPFTLQGQHWDLEGMFMNGTQLSLVGGYDFKNGVTHAGYTYRSGDIFFDVNGDAKYGHAINGGSGVGGIVNNTFGYDFALQLDYTAMTFKVIGLDATTWVNRGTDVPSSNPWRYSSGGVDTGITGSFNYIGGLSGAEVGGMLGYGGNDTHYVISLDTSFLSGLVASGSSVTWHYTMECGNDNLMGRSAVPDTATTLALFGSALLGLAGFRRWSIRA